MKDFVGIWINRAVQPELLAVEGGSSFINRELIRRKPSRSVVDRLYEPSCE